MSYQSLLLIVVSAYVTYITIVNAQCYNPTLIATGYTQKFSSPNYPYNYSSNFHCTWKITASPLSNIVVLFVEDFNLEISTLCTYDNVSIYDGQSISSPKITTLCSDGMSKLYVSSGSYLTIEFTTDSSKVDTGFQMQYFSFNSKGDVINTTIGTTDTGSNHITSPNYPNNFLSNTSFESEWHIIADEPTRTVTLNIVRLFINSTMPSCDDSYIAIYNGISTLYPEMRTICGQMTNTSMGHTFISTGPAITVLFHSNSSLTPKYFLIEYSTTPVTDYCGNIYLHATSTVQYITSPNYPLLYPNLVDCEWRISTSSTLNFVQLTVLDFRIESSPSTVCTYDYLSIYNGNITSSTMITSLCGLIGSYMATSTGRFMTLKFHSDSSNSDTGFKLQYVAVDQQVPGNCSNMNLQASSVTQDITSPNYPLSYTNNLDCQWRITATSASYVIKLVFYSFSLESSPSCNYDNLTIYDGSSTFSTRIVTLCGMVSVPDITSTSTSLMLKFHSDNSNVATGFRIQYSTVYKQASCSSQYLTAYSSVNYIYSPNYPSNYYSNTDCTWHISASRIDYVVSLTIVAFTLESGDCNSDYLKIYDGTSTYSTQLKWICGSYFSTTEIVSTGNDMVIVFHSNWYNNYSGFKISYRSKDPNPSSGLSGGAIAGIVTGVLLVVFLFSIIAVYNNKNWCTNKTNGRGVTNPANRPTHGGAGPAINGRNAPVSVVSRPNMSMPAQRPLQPGQQPETFTQAYPSQFTGYSHPGQFGISNAGFTDAYGPPPPYSTVVTQS